MAKESERGGDVYLLVFVQVGEVLTDNALASVMSQML